MSDIFGNSTDVDYENKVVVNLEIGAYALAVSIIVLFTCLERNQKGGRPGIAIPVDLLNNDKLTYAYAAAFGCASSSILQLILSVDTESFHASEDVKPWIQIPVWLALSTITSLKFYPLFASIGYKPPILGTLIGFVYCGYLLSQLLYKLVQVEIQTKDFSSIISSVPIIVCYVVLLCHFAWRAFWEIKTLRRRQPNFSQIQATNNSSGYERAYVKWLLQKKETSPIINTETNVYRKLQTYKTGVKTKLDINTPLRTSPRVVSTFVVSGMILLQVGINLCILYRPLRKLAVDYAKDNLINSTVLPQVKIFTHVTDVSFYTSFISSTLIMSIYIVLIYRNYQKDLIKMYHGDFSFLPKRVRKTENKHFVADSLRYAGTQIAYIFWCYLVVFVSILLLCYMMAYLLILPLMGKVPGEFLVVVKTILPVTVARYLFYFAESFLVNRFFLQKHSVRKEGTDEEQRVIALRNRKMFSVMSYFMFFFHVIIGFVDSISRIIYGAVIGIVTVARIDRSLLPRGYEHLDLGYLTYVGLIMLELYHRNPVLLVFCEELIITAKQKENVHNVTLELPNEQGYQRRESRTSVFPRQKQILNRWQKAYTLIKNPSLRKTEKSSRNIFYRDEVVTSGDSEA